jgi:hypothetical protein
VENRGKMETEGKNRKRRMRIITNKRKERPKENREAQ